MCITILISYIGCPTGWTLRGGGSMCYQFFQDIKSHGEAIDYCFSQDAILATPKDAAEADFIANNVIRYDFVVSHVHWRIQRGAEGTFAPPPLKTKKSQINKKKKMEKK